MVTTFSLKQVETRTSHGPIPHPFNGILTVTRFDILTSFWGPFQHLRPFNIWDLIGYLRLFSAFDTLLIQHLKPYSLLDAPQHLRRFSINIWDLIRYLRPFQHLTPLWRTFETLFVIWDPFQHLTPFWLTRPPINQTSIWWYVKAITY